MKQRILSLAFLFCLAMTLTACGGQNGGASQDGTADTTPMTEEEYMAEVEAANTAMGEAMTAISGLSATDEESFRAGLETMRELSAPLRDLASISNPPESFAEAHAKISEGSTLFADSIDTLCDSATALLDGEMTAEDYSTAVADCVTDLTEAATQLSEGLSMLEQ